MAGPEKKVFSLVVEGVGIEGVERTTHNPHTERDGQTVTAEALKRTIVAHERLYKEARKFETAARGLQDRFGRKVIGFGHLTDADGADAFQRAADKLAEEISEFNGQVNNPHKVRISIMKVRTLSVCFDDDDMQRLYSEVGAELSRLRDMLASGDHEGLMNALKRQQRLPGCLPSINATVIADALEALRVARNMGAAHLRLHPGDLPGYLALPEVAGALEASESALGFCSPAVVVAMPKVQGG